MSLNGRWRGKLLDALGPSARLDVEMRDDRGELSGRYEVTFLSDDTGGCREASDEVAQKGKLSGKVSGEDVEFRVEMNVGGSPVAVHFQGWLAKADPHALRAIAGTYDAKSGGDELSLEGGGCLLWLYGKGLEEGGA